MTDTDAGPAPATADAARPNLFHDCVLDGDGLAVTSWVSGSEGEGPAAAVMLRAEDAWRIGGWLVRLSNLGPDAAWEAGAALIHFAAVKLEGGDMDAFRARLRAANGGPAGGHLVTGDLPPEDRPACP